MSVVLKNLMLKKLLLQSQNKYRLWAALSALCVGTMLFLVAVMIWWNFHELLFGKNQNDSLGSTFMIIGKKVTDQNMAIPTATIFQQAEIDDIGKAPQVEDVGIISSNRFPVYAMMGGNLGFATDLPLESVPDKFIDKMPPEWKWQPGSTDLPIIISSQFLDIYNYVFAPSQNLPQLSETSVKSLALKLKIGKDNATEILMAHVVGFSDRIGSVLAPQSFIDYGNKTYGKANATVSPSQLILKTKDPSDTKFGNYLQQHNYNTNSQNLRWSKIRAIVEVVTAATGVLALLLMGIGTLVIILFIELTIAKAQSSLTLLKQIGYSPHFLTQFMIKRFIPLVLATSVIALFIASALQLVTATVIKSQGLELSVLPGYPVWGAFIVSTFILLALVSKSISGAIKK